MEVTIHIALVHLAVRYKEPEVNRNRLLELNRRAAESGANLIVNTEMSVSGYSFQSLEDVAAYTEASSGPTLTGIRDIASAHYTYICLGMAEKDDRTGIFHNTAFVVRPDGAVVCRYRKINAEARWACPGNSVQDNVFTTPWGRIGVLICSDTYHGLLPRQTALRGADMIIVPANWPASGMNPRELWCARAMENGVYLLACNRGGKDRMMDCKDAWTCGYAPDGQELFAECSDVSKIIDCHITLPKDKRLPEHFRKQMIARRSPETYQPIYLDLRFATLGGASMTEYYELPPTGLFRTLCLVPEKDTPLTPETIAGEIGGYRQNEFQVLVLPSLKSEKEASDLLRNSMGLVRDVPVAATAGFNNGQECSGMLLAFKDRFFRYVNQHSRDNVKEKTGPVVADVGPLRIGLCCAEELRHPEVALAYAKMGCDLVAASADQLVPADRLLIGVKTIEQTAVAVSANNMAIICRPPEGHQRWEEASIEGAGACEMIFDSAFTRQKRFQDRIDFECLLRRREAQQ